MAGGATLREAVESLAAESLAFEAEPSPEQPYALVQAVGGDDEARRLLRAAGVKADTARKRVARWRSAEVRTAHLSTVAPLIEELDRRRQLGADAAFAAAMARTFDQLRRRGCRWAVEGELRVSGEIRYRRHPARGTWPMSTTDTRPWLALAASGRWTAAEWDEEDGFLALGLRKYLSPELAGSQIWDQDDELDAADLNVTWIELQYGRGGASP